MLSFMIFCHVWFLHTGLTSCSENSTVIRFSVLEDQQVCLPCGGPDSSDVVWTHRDREVLVTRQGGHETNEDVRRYHLLPDGQLCLLKVDEADGGEFGCNQRPVAELQVLSDVVEKKQKEEKKRPENALLILAVVGLGLMIILLTAVCVLLTSMKCRRRKKYRAAKLYESPSVPEETIHYASLGRHNWRERPCRTQPDQNLHNVIYSSVITRPAAK
ncbi:hypothetical protein L3Q82_003235 [Scortum barcoo]|uniref:Uncharacterized protein n=1 Tax=Scortum barcoo TaxID=214431 RepID=A0ACB8VRK2_9TELE|nr:hypothetical protein L3Q82_003235 [Scortum barcoo]